jgi:hypothetical protein
VALVEGIIFGGNVAVAGSLAWLECTCFCIVHANSLTDHSSAWKSNYTLADDSTYDTVFQTTSNVTLILRVNMPPLVHLSAPIRRPLMTLAGIKARHSWLDERMQVVGFAPIKSDDAWRTSRLLLGAAVHQVIQQLQIHSPDIIEITDKGLRSIQPKQQHGMISNENSQPSKSIDTSAAQSTYQATSAAANRKSTASFASKMEAPPDYDSSFSQPPSKSVQLPRQFDEIESLSLSRLEELLRDELEFMAFCHSLPSLQNARGRGQERFNMNVATATLHLSRKDGLEIQSRQVIALRDSLKERVNAFQNLQQRQEALLAPPDENIALHQLALEKKRTLQESEQLAEDWLDQGAAEPLVFVKEFVERRKQHHMTAAKLELLQLQRRR